MTSVIDFSAKVSEYVLTCRQMGISILPPDINEGESVFSVSSGGIRYGLSAIKSVGKSVIEKIVEERESHGPFISLKDFIYRIDSKELNKRVVENLIKSGAFDSLPGNRKQKLMVYAELMERKNKEQKSEVAGQMSLFDLIEPETAARFDTPLPDVEEYDKDMLLAFEKEVLGIYISGHPMEACEELWQKNVTAVTTDFYLDEESGQTKVRDGAYVTIGGMITARSVKATKKNQMMAFFTVEDLTGSVEVIVFPQNYEAYRPMLETDRKVFVRGRVNSDGENQAKLICEKLIPFDQIPREVWIQFTDKEAYTDAEEELFRMLSSSDGDSRVVIYLSKERGIKRLPPSRNVAPDEETLAELQKKYGQSNVKVVEKSIENLWKMH